MKMNGDDPACDDDRSWPFLRTERSTHSGNVEGFRPSSRQRWMPDALDVEGSRSSTGWVQREAWSIRNGLVPLPATTPVDLIPIPENEDYAAVILNRRSSRRSGQPARAELPRSVGELHPCHRSAHSYPPSHPANHSRNYKFSGSVGELYSHRRSTYSYHSPQPTNHSRVQGELRTKCVIPDFDGNLFDEYYLEWEKEVENFLDYTDMSQEKFVRNVIHKLVGRAAAWWYHLTQARYLEGRSNVKTWSKMKRLLRAQFLTPRFDILSTSAIPIGRCDGESTLKYDKYGLVVCNRDVGLSHDVQVVEQCINLSLQENLCKIASNLVAGEPNLGKNDDHVLENYPNNDFENPYSRVDTGIVDVPNNSVAFLPTNTSKLSIFQSKESVMEIEKYTQRVLQRIQKIEPQNVTKIFGYLLLQHSLEQLMDYAMGDEEQIRSLIDEAKSYLISSPKLSSSEHLLPFVSHNNTVHRSFSSPSTFRAPAPLHLTANHQNFIQNIDLISHNNEVWSMEDQLQPLSPMGFDLQGNFYFPDTGLCLRNRSPLSCHYFYNGYCKHGQSCKFSHGQANPDIINQSSGIGLNEFTVEDNLFSPGCLEQLEMEIAEILKARRGLPVSIASLPMLYQEMYGKALQAEGYLTESQRHGKAGYSLTKLLAQLRNVRLMDRPHGQHFVILAEDAPKYMEFRRERNDYGASSSHQIYLTFPAESIFTDADVQNYFNQFGPVHDVRIPRQEKRMFGFVSFYCPETVRQILAMGHPHIICGARVLVKPYKEKSRLVDRKYAENLDAQMYLSPHSFEMDNGLSTTLHSALAQRACDTSQLPLKQQIEDFYPTFDLTRRQLFEQQLSPMPVAAHPFLDYGLEDSKFLEGLLNQL